MESVVINGVRVTPQSLPAWAAGQSGICREVADFLAEWWGPAAGIALQSSGSTGAPKCFCARREFLGESARASLAVFGLQAGQRALLCLPLRYIAGKMMVVRALVGGLHLVCAEPSSTPLPAPSEGFIDFAPLVPLQAARTLEQSDGRARLENVGTLLLGGGFIDGALERALQGLRCRVFASYGMTETFSHVALRRVNGRAASQAYTPLPHVQVAIDGAGRLGVSSAALGIDFLQTNDLAEWADEKKRLFRILGRCDAVICSGGVKIQAESVEAALAAAGVRALALPLPDAALGQCVALVHEPCAANTLAAALGALPRYHRPRRVFCIESLPRTATGKVSRAATVAWLAEQTADKS